MKRPVLVIRLLWVHLYGVLGELMEKVGDLGNRLNWRSYFAENEIHSQWSELNNKDC